MLIGPIAGFLLGQFVSLPFVSPQRVLDRIVVEGPPSVIEIAMIMVIPEWNHDAMFTVIGFLVACAIIYLLEEARRFKQRQ